SESWAVGDMLSDRILQLLDQCKSGCESVKVHIHHRLPGIGIQVGAGASSGGPLSPRESVSTFGAAGDTSRRVHRKDQDVHETPAFGEVVPFEGQSYSRNLRDERARHF